MEAILELSDGIDSILPPDSTEEELPPEAEIETEGDTVIGSVESEIEYVTVEDYSGQLGAIEYQISRLNASVDLFLYGYVPVMVGAIAVTLMFTWFYRTFLR